MLEKHCTFKNCHRHCLIRNDYKNTTVNKNKVQNIKCIFKKNQKQYFIISKGKIIFMSEIQKNCSTDNFFCIFPHFYNYIIFSKGTLNTHNLLLKITCQPHHSIQ